MMDCTRKLNRPEFSLASRYEPDCVLDNQMGLNALWLVEWLLRALPLKPGMRVLDLGCGRALSSIFMARKPGKLCPLIPGIDLFLSTGNQR